MKRKNLSLISDKKGNAILDTIFVIVILFVFAVVSFIGYSIFDDLNTDVQNNIFLSNESKVISSDLYARFPEVMDGTFILAFALLWILAIIASFMIDAHPIFFVTTLIILFIVLFVGIILANSYEELAGDTFFSAYSMSFPMTEFIFKHYLLFGIGIISSISVVLFGKNRLMG